MNTITEKEVVPAPTPVSPIIVTISNQNPK
jgi:hypothetical protein